MVLAGKRMNEHLVEGADIAREEQKDITALLKGFTGQADANAYHVKAIFDLTNSIRELDTHSTELSTKMINLTNLLFWFTVVMTVATLVTLWKTFIP